MVSHFLMYLQVMFDCDPIHPLLCVTPAVAVSAASTVMKNLGVFF